MMVGLVGLAYATGVGALGFELLYFIATLTLLALLCKRVWHFARERRWVSPAEMLSDLYGSRILGIIVSLLHLVSLIPYASAQLIGIGSLLEGIEKGWYVYGVLLGALITFLWTCIAGIWSVASTDAFQGLWMIGAALGFLSWFLLSYIPSFNIDYDSLIGILSEKGILGITSFWGCTNDFSIYNSMDILYRYKSSSSSEALHAEG